MKVLRKELSKMTCLKAVLIFLSLGLVFAGCAGAPKPFDPDVKGAQMIVGPDHISLGVATLTKTPLVFKGKGFEPEDSVFITLLNVPKGNKTVHVPIADAEVDKKGCFTAKVSTLVKVTQFLNAKLGSNKKMENIIIVTQPPIPPGTYTARAVSMMSDKFAVCKLLVQSPSPLEKFKDDLGEAMGKIVIKR